MTIYADQNNDSNNVNLNEIADQESSFIFKGFTYVISILGQDIKPENNDLKEKIKTYVNEVSEQCVGKYINWQFWKDYCFFKKSSVPLIVLFDSKNRFVKTALEELELKDKNIALVAVVSEPVVPGIKEKLELNDYSDITEYNKSHNQQQDNNLYFWSDPRFNSQKSAIDQRQLNEFIAQRSHLTIVYSDYDVFSDSEEKIDSLIWSIRYKLEGDPGSQYQQEQNEKITYPAIGPVLYIVNDGEKSETFLFPSREPITEEQNNNTEEKDNFKEDKKKKEDKKHIRVVKKEHKDSKKDNDKTIISECFEIVDNLRILKKLNSAINESDYIPKDDNLNIESLSIVSTGTKDTPEETRTKDTPEDIQSAIKCYHIVHNCAKKFKERTKRSINNLSVLLLFVLLCNAILIYLNDICLTSIHTNAIQVTRDYFNKYPAIIKYAVKVETFPINLLLKNGPSNDNAESGHNIPTLNYKDTNVSLLSFFFVYYCSWLFISIIFIACISKSYICEKPHYQYHRFQTLADCLRVQVYWKYAGMPDEISTNFRAHQIPEIDWLKIVLNGLEIQLHSSNSSIANDDKTLEDKVSCLDKCWLENRINNEFTPELQNGFWKRFKDNFGWNKDNIWKSSNIYLISLLLFVSPFLLVLLLQLYKIALYVFPLSILKVSLLLAVLMPIFVCSVLIKKYWEQLINFCKKISDMIVNNKGRLLEVFSLSVLVYFCLSGFFELIRLSNLCSPHDINENAVTEIAFGYLTEILRLIIQIIVAFVLIIFFNIRMHMFDKEKRRIELLLPCFDVADRSIDVIISEPETREKIASRMYKKNKDLIEDIFDKIVDSLYDRINEMLKKHDLIKDLRELVSLGEVDIDKVIDFDDKITDIDSKNIDSDINIDNKKIDFDSSLYKIDKFDIPFDVKKINNNVKLDISKVIDNSDSAIDRISNYFDSRNIVTILDKDKEEIRNIINDQLGSKGIFSGVINYFSGNNKKIDELINKLHGKIDNVTRNLKEDKDRIIDIVKDNLKVVSDVITENNRKIEIAKKKNNDVIDSINKANKEIDLVEENINFIKNNINDQINIVNEAIKGKFEGFNNIIKNKVDNVKKNVKDVVNEKITQVNEDVKKEVGKIKENVKRRVCNISDVIAKVKNEAEEFKNNLDDKSNNIKKDLDSDIKTIIDEKLSKIGKVSSENAKISYLKNILLELGQEVLAKRIDWLLNVNDRDLKSPK